MTLEDRAEKGFQTDQQELVEVDVLIEDETPDIDSLAEEPARAAVIGRPWEGDVRVVHDADLSVLDVRPTAGTPREYRFPRFERARVSNGLTVVSAHVPGRALLAASLIAPGGAWTESADQGGVTVLTARAMPEGTRRLSATEFIESSERLGAEIHADASWEALTATLEVPRSKFGDALALLSEMAFEPAFPADDVERLRDERLNDLLQAWSDPRRRAERVFQETVYASSEPYSRPLAGIQSSVRHLDRDAVAARHANLIDPSTATLVVAGDLTGLSLMELAEQHLGQRSGPESKSAESGSSVEANPAGARVVLVDKPGAPQSELRIGHVGVPRKTPGFHAIAVLNAILGGTFNSRLNRVIREEKGYSYGIHSTFDMRRRAGPFAVRCAVETAVTAPALEEIMRIVGEMTERAPDADELNVARDYLVGVFPLRFEAAAQVAAALAGLVVFDLPDDELDTYRPAVAAVSADDVLEAAQRNIRPAELCVVIVGDAREVEPALRGSALGSTLTVIPSDTSPE
ncbi:MAG: pitrilysin family protein [Candidatus Limnocylindrales bacterium]